MHNRSKYFINAHDDEWFATSSPNLTVFKVWRVRDRCCHEVLNLQHVPFLGSIRSDVCNLVRVARHGLQRWAPNHYLIYCTSESCEFIYIACIHSCWLQIRWGNEISVIAVVHVCSLIEVCAVYISTLLKLTTCMPGHKCYNIYIIYSLALSTTKVQNVQLYPLVK